MPLPSLHLFPWLFQEFGCPAGAPRVNSTARAWNARLPQGCLHIPGPFWMGWQTCLLCKKGDERRSGETWIHHSVCFSYFCRKSFCGLQLVPEGKGLALLVPHCGKRSIVFSGSLLPLLCFLSPLTKCVA